MVGGLVMTHSDDYGLILPPRLAPVHVAIVPIYRKAKERAAVLEAAEKVKSDLSGKTLWNTPLEIEVDDREEYKPGYKYYYWEARGVPLRLELGPRDLKNEQATGKRRFGVPGGKENLPLQTLADTVPKLLEEMQKELFTIATDTRTKKSREVDDYEEFKTLYGEGQSVFSYAHWCENPACEAKIKEDTKVSIRCIPLQRDPEQGKCLVCGKPSPGRVLMAKAY